MECMPGEGCKRIFIIPTDVTIHHSILSTGISVLELFCFEISFIFCSWFQWKSLESLTASRNGGIWRLITLASESKQKDYKMKSERPLFNSRPLYDPSIPVPLPHPLWCPSQWQLQPRREFEWHANQYRVRLQLFNWVINYQKQINNRPIWVSLQRPPSPSQITYGFTSEQIFFIILRVQVMDWKMANCFSYRCHIIFSPSLLRHLRQSERQ